MISLKVATGSAILLALAACGGQKAPANNVVASAPTTPAAQADWQSTPSGLRYRRIAGDGTGPKPTLADLVTFHYVGRLMDGTEFDSSLRNGEPATFPLANLIPGWKEGLPLISVGDTYEFIVPPELGYGAAGAGNDIPPNATLYFRIALLGINGQS